jgi:glycosyltransferase XagB
MPAFSPIASASSGRGMSARDGLSGHQRAILVLLAAIILTLGAVTLEPISAAALVLSPLYLLHILFALGAALERPVPERGPSAGVPAPATPSYSILVPLYDEAAVVPQIVRTLQAIDYPADLLDIWLLVEDDDLRTIEALALESLPATMTILRVPAGGPRTKPNALNHGLAASRGAYVTVYDAEDIPEPGQLRRAAAMFSVVPADVVCLQARLVIDNPADSWLSLMMTIEYAALFDATKCGYAAMAMPVALGGSSNHFRRDALVALGGWDAWNVTEDADLGLRLARRGWFVGDLPSATLEEAPFRLASWFSQRRRWHKGFIQTVVSNSHAPRDGIRAMGLLNWLAGLTQVSGSVLGAFLFPFFSAHVLWLWLSGALSQNDGPMQTAMNTATLTVMICGLMSVFYPAVIGLWRRRLWHLAPWLLTLPFYLLLISAAAWFATIDYVRSPFTWLKTDHGGGTRGLAALRSRRGSR